MTIVISAKTSEGLVLGADSMVAESTVQNKQTFITNTFENAKKLFQLKDYPIGVLIWGISQIGDRNIGSLVDEFGNKLSGFKDMTSGKLISNPYKLKNISQGLFEFIKERYVNFKCNDKLGILVGGYSFNEFFPEEYLFELPKSVNLQELRPNDSRGNPTFGVNWYGLTDGIVRFHWGYDDNMKSLIMAELKDKGINTDIIIKIDRLFLNYQFPLSIGGMPIQDVIDYVNYLINIMIGRYRFYQGVPLCGGEVDIAVITYKGFEWIKTKKWRVGNEIR